MPRAIASRGVRDVDGLAVERDGAGDQPIDAEDGAGKFGAARADQSGQAQNFAAPERQAKPACSG